MAFAFPSRMKILIVFSTLLALAVPTLLITPAQAESPYQRVYNSMRVEERFFSVWEDGVPWFETAVNEKIEPDRFCRKIAAMFRIRYFCYQRNTSVKADQLYRSINSHVLRLEEYVNNRVTTTFEKNDNTWLCQKLIPQTERAEPTYQCFEKLKL